MSNLQSSAGASPPAQSGNPFSVALAAAINPLISRSDVALINNIVLLVEESIHRVTTMDETELRNFLPWLFYNDGELSTLKNGDLATLQVLLRGLVPKPNWPRP